MKKLILSITVLAGITFAACSSDDDSVKSNCVQCDFEEASEVCEGDNGNAYVNGVDTQQGFNDYVSTFCE